MLGVGTLAEVLRGKARWPLGLRWTAAASKDKTWGKHGVGLNDIENYAATLARCHRCSSWARVSRCAAWTACFMSERATHTTCPAGIVTAWTPNVTKLQCRNTREPIDGWLVATCKAASFIVTRRRPDSHHARNGPRLQCYSYWSQMNRIPVAV